MNHSIGQNIDGYRLRFENLPPPSFSTYLRTGELSSFPGRLPLCPPVIKVKCFNCGAAQSIRYQVTARPERRKTSRRNVGRSISLTVQRSHRATAICVRLNFPGDPGPRASPRGRRIHAVFGKFLRAYGASPDESKTHNKNTKIELIKLGNKARECGVTDTDEFPDFLRGL